MKALLRLILAGVVLACSFAGAAAQGPVVVELFTSEGCSSCPPADSVLRELSRQPAGSTPQVVLLGEHVDYWNYIGWTDRFSSPQFSQRQSDYARAFHLSGGYTPQMVIDGQVQFVGNDPTEVWRKIEAATKDPKPVQVALQWQGNNLQINLTVPPGTARGKVLLAVTEDGLSTQVEAGENGGRTLHHAAVVRQLRELGTSDKKTIETTVAPARDWNAAQLKVAILVQDPDTKKILGAASTPYPR
jgi:hypothetical protein